MAKILIEEITMFFWDEGGCKWLIFFSLFLEFRLGGRKNTMFYKGVSDLFKIVCEKAAF